MTTLLRASDEFRDWLTEWGHNHGTRTTAEALDALREFVTSATARAEYLELGKAEKFARPLRGKRLKRSVYS
jgi:hypothetical protein